MDRDLEFTFRSTLKYLRATGQDDKITQVTHRYMAGLAVAEAVTLWKLEDDDMLDVAEITYFVQRHGNPTRVVFATGDAAAAHARFAEEINLWRDHYRRNSKFGELPREL